MQGASEGVVNRRLLFELARFKATAFEKGIDYTVCQVELPPWVPPSRPCPGRKFTSPDPCSRGMLY